jgi:hypothetical protein
MHRPPQRTRNQQSHPQPSPQQLSPRQPSLLLVSQRLLNRNLIPHRVEIDVDSDLEGREPKVRSQQHQRTSLLRNLPIS